NPPCPPPVTPLTPPSFFASIAGRSLPPHLITATWGYASALALAIAAVVAPITGTTADQLGRRKPLLLVCVVLGCLTTALIAVAPAGSWQVLLALFGVGFVAFATGNVLYD